MKARRISPIVFAVLATAAMTFGLAMSAQAQTETILHNFDDKGDGGAPYSGLMIDASGNLYGSRFGRALSHVEK
jgi:hypothetical protein